METENTSSDVDTGDQLEVPNAIIVKIVDKLLPVAKARLNPNFFSLNSKALSKYGIIGIYAFAAVILILCTVLSFDVGFSYFLIGISVVIGCLLLLYIAVKFLTSPDTLIKSNPSQLSSQAFLDTVAVVTIFSGFLSLIGLTVVAILDKNVNYFLFGLGAFILLELFACIPLHPEMVNIKFNKNLSGVEEALGITSFFVKGFIKLTPIFFGSWVIIGCITLFLSFILNFSEPGYALPVATSAATMVIFASLLPLLNYLTFIFYYLTIDIIHSIISIPRKLDKAVLVKRSK